MARSRAMARTVNIPLDLLDDPKAVNVGPAGKRLYVTAWAICDDKGVVPKETLDRATERWGDELAADARLTLPEILADLQRLGFLREVRKRGDVFQFKRSGEWLS